MVVSSGPLPAIVRLPATSARAARAIPQLNRRLKPSENTSLGIMRFPRGYGGCWEVKNDTRTHAGHAQCRIGS